MEKKEIRFDKTINSIKIDTQVANVVVYTGETEQPIALLSGKFSIIEDKYNPIIEEETATTTIKIKNGIIRTGNISIFSNTSINNLVINRSYCNSDYDSSNIEIVLPKRLRGLSLYVHTMSGYISISDVFLEDLIAKSMSGDITLKNIDFNLAKIDTMSGDVDLETCNFMDNFKTHLSTMCGDVVKKEDKSSYDNSPNMNMNTATEKHSLKINTMSGDIKVLFKGKKIKRS